MCFQGMFADYSIRFLSPGNIPLSRYLEESKIIQEFFINSTDFSHMERRFYLHQIHFGRPEENRRKLEKRNYAL